MPLPDAAPELAALYQSLILDHYRRPRNRGALEHADASVTVKNPLCGDQLELQVTFDDAGAVRAVRFRGEGCSISLATASMMTELVEGKTREEIDELAARFARMLEGDTSATADEMLGDLRALSGVARVPARIKCALLPWDAIKAVVSRES